MFVNTTLAPNEPHHGNRLERQQTHFAVVRTLVGEFGFAFGNSLLPSQSVALNRRIERQSSGSESVDDLN